MSRSVSSIAGLLALALSVSACEAASEKASAPPSGDTSTASAEPAAPQAAPLTASGPAETLSALPGEDESIQSAASVARMDWVSDGGAKLFGTAGGDPAMNGLYTYVGFYGGPGDGWTVFQLGDFLDYTVLSSSPGRVDLDLHESILDEASGEISSRHRKVIVTWTPGADDAPPAAITVAPGQ